MTSDWTLMRDQMNDGWALVLADSPGDNGTGHGNGDDPGYGEGHGRLGGGFGAGSGYDSGNGGGGDSNLFSRSGTILSRGMRWLPSGT